MSLKAFFSGSAIYVCARILSAGFPFLFLPVTARQLTVQEYGAVELITIVNTLIAAIASSAALSSYTFYYHKTEEKNELKAGILSWLLAPGLCLTLGSFLLVSLSSFWQETFDNSAHMTVGLVLLFVSTQYISAIINILRMTERVAHCASYQVLSGFLIYLLATWMVVYSPGDKFNAFVGGLIVGNALAAIAGQVMVVPMRSYSHLGMRSAIRHWRMIALFGFPLIPATLAESLLGLVDRFLILRFADRAALGLYSMGSRVSSAILIITQGVMFAFLPYALRLIHEQSSEAVSKTLGPLWLKLSGVLMFFICLLTTLAPTLMLLFGGSAYAEAAGVVPWISFALVFYSFTYFTYLGTLKAEKTYLFSLSVLFGLLGIVSTPYCFELLFEDGAGAETIAFGRLLGASIVVFVSLFFSQRCYPLSWPWRRLSLQWSICLGFISLISFMPAFPFRYGLLILVLVLLAAVTLTKQDIKFVLNKYEIVQKHG